MKKLLLFIFSVILFNSSNVFSQNYTPLLNDYNSWCVWFQGFENEAKILFKTNDYVSINGLRYKPITTKQNSSTAVFLRGYIREDTLLKKVYYLEYLKKIEEYHPFWSSIDSTYLDSTEYILYDFSKTIGDSIYVNDISDPEKTLRAAFINDTFRDKGIKHYELTYKNEFGYYNNVIWAEGYGSLYGVITNLSLVENAYEQDLLCTMKDSNNVVFISSFNCESTVSIEHNYSSNTLHVYPNPTKDNLNFVSERNIERIDLFDLNGKLVLSTSATSINTSTFSNGMYFYSVLLKNGKLVSGKFIKE